VQAAFSRKRLNGWIPMMVDRADAAIDAVVSTIGTRTQTVDLFPYGRQAVLGIAVHAFFGERLAARAEKIGALFSRPQKYLESSAIRQLPHPLPFTRRANVRDDRRALDAIIDAEIDHRRRQPAGDPLDVLDVLAHDNTLTDAEIRDQVVTLIGAGYDTTSASFSWTLWRAAQPEIWARLRAEADEVLGPPDAPNGTPDTDTLARLVFANRVMREALRLHPAGTLSPREATVDIELGGHTIRKGTLILWSAHLAGRDPDAWSDPLRFDPDRFADLSPEQKAIADQAWVPFGRGARNCIGFMLAQMELTLMIARFAQRLDVSLTSDTVPRPVGMVVNRPTGGAPMRVTARVS
jgi:cytochrome P450